jgi:hypothetical protein
LGAELAAGAFCNCEGVGEFAPASPLKSLGYVGENRNSGAAHLVLQPPVAAKEEFLVSA